MIRKKIKFLISGILMFSLFLLISGCGCKQTVQKYTINLEIWGPVDDADAYSEIFTNYKKLNPHIGTITYKKQRIENYQKDLVDALASGQGPDIFLIHNDWLANFSNKITPAPKDILSEQRYRQNFVDVCASDFVSDGAIFATPLSVNSLALYYNKDLFNVTGITTPPKTWDEFSADVLQLTKVNSTGEITQSGAAIGTAYNINRSTDILNLLFLQKGISMRDTHGTIAFSKNGLANTVLEFYTQFANTNSSNYTWNPTLHYSIDTFSEGSLAMMLNYSWQEAILRSKSPKLNFAVAPVPQFTDSNFANFANYWAFAVAKNKTISNNPTTSKVVPVSNDLRIAEAWKFLTYLTTKGEATKTQPTGISNVYDPTFDPASNYLNLTKQPAARRDLIDKQKSDPDLGVFAEGNLLAKDWKQTDSVLMETVFAEMIDLVNRGAKTTKDAISSAEQKLLKN